MKTITIVAAVLPLAIAVAACAKREAANTLAPEPPGARDGLVIGEGAWVTDRDALSAAAASASRRPLVQAAIAEYGADRLREMPEYHVRAVGTTTTGLPVEFTLLSFMADGDETHGVFVTQGTAAGEEVTQRGELIVGRDPRPDEPGYVPLSIQGRLVWIRDEGSVRPGGIAGAPEQLDKIKFLSCLIANAPGACDAGATIAATIAPGYPQARAVGCGVGVAVAALSCLAGSRSGGVPTPKDF
ncbi:MAG TPA: hypothetical protein VLT84_03320 [Acidobacteriota bacterium]|nr:hypothetical protein [Acidobacteriota bacterium]